jgi:hypothetical protein
MITGMTKHFKLTFAEFLRNFLYLHVASMGEVRGACNILLGGLKGGDH